MGRTSVLGQWGLFRARARYHWPAFLREQSELSRIVAAMRPSEALRAYRSQLREIVARHGALRPRVFGSAIHGDDTEDSDLDLLIDPTPRTTLMTLAAIQLEAERLLGVRVDVLTPKSLPQRFRERVLLEAVPV